MSCPNAARAGEVFTFGPELGLLGSEMTPAHIKRRALTHFPQAGRHCRQRGSASTTARESSSISWDEFFEAPVVVEPRLVIGGCSSESKRVTVRRATLRVQERKGP